MADKEIRLWHCKRCEHKWANRKAQKPFVCPQCHSYLWNIPKDSEKGSDEQTKNI